MDITSLPNEILSVLNGTIELFHICLTLFVTFGWLVIRLRKLHLLFTSFVLFSWVVLGYFYGWGYCFLTEFHWQIKEALGATNLPYSFIGYSLDKYLGIDLSDSQIDVLSYTALGISVFATISINLKFYLKSKYGHK